MRDEESAAPPRVHVIDDDESFRNSMLRMLAANHFPAAGYRCAGEFLLANVLDDPGCMLLDISMPGPSGVELLKALRSRHWAPPVVLLTGYDDVLTSVDAMKSGAVDYILKPADADRILHAVRKALQIDEQRRAARRAIEELRSRFAQLSEAERTIFFGIANSKLNKQLAVQLGFCERTIKARRARMMLKLQIRSLPDLVRASRILETCEPAFSTARALDASADVGREPTQSA
ncbi:MAG TPA: response regulator [Steroidobacter sp.]|nr:response regulator [Steroidobacter sp.]